MRTKIKQLKIDPVKDPAAYEALVGKEIALKGWIRTVRNQKSFAFIEINDGSTLSNFQVIAESTLPDYEATLHSLSTGASVSIRGILVKSPGKNQSLELQAKHIELIGSADPETYPLQKKRHSLEFLRSLAHLRPRTNCLGAVARVRSAMAMATHCFFQERGFLYLQSPIITGSDCEGAGEMFQVTTLSGPEFAKAKAENDFSADFFRKPAFLTVSGQLNGESFACALSDVYTFGPTFRAEKSNTSRHLAEFWMIEPEMAFADLKDDMDCAEEYIKYVLKYALEHCFEDLQFFEQFIAKGLIERLEGIASSSFERASYTESVRILQASNRSFEYPVEWGGDLQTEHERFLAEEFFKKPVIITDYPKQIKAFYMRDNEDGKTVAAMDVLVPKIGEIIGGSQREERLDRLQAKLQSHNLSEKEYWWYLELRKYGSVPHAGFGVGFERLVQFVTGMENIRDINAFPRYPAHADF